MKHRLCIFAYYDVLGVIDDYVIVLLKETAKIASKIIIVCNGFLRPDQNFDFIDIPYEVHYRKNIGYDAGAYKDALLYFMNKDELNKYDELILMNDTFYGPFHPWNSIFDCMSRQKCDFWGLTEYLNSIEESNVGILSHIQSYFLVFEQKILADTNFMCFWRDLSYPNSYKEAIKNFEVGISQYLIMLGYKYCSYASVQGAGTFLEEGRNIYLEHSNDLIEKYGFPILKCKAISFDYYDQAKAAMQYIDCNTSYDVGLIIGHLHRLDDNELIQPFSIKKLNEFISQYDEIYIYGRGNIGSAVGRYLQDCGRKVRFIVSDTEDIVSNDTIHLSDFEIKANMGVIIGVGRRLLNEILQALENVVPNSQLFCPDY